MLRLFQCKRRDRGPGEKSERENQQAKRRGVDFCVVAGSSGTELHETQ